MTVGAVAGPFVGGVLADYFGMHESFFVASVALGLISLLIGFCINVNFQRFSTPYPEVA